MMYYTYLIRGQGILFSYPIPLLRATATTTLNRLLHSAAILLHAAPTNAIIFVQKLI